MSFDLCVLDTNLTITADEANQLYQQALDAEEAGEPNEKVNSFIREITSHYPQIDDYPDDDVDDCPWNVAFDVTETSVIICMSWSPVEDVASLIINTAAKHNLACYDPQENKGNHILDA